MYGYVYVRTNVVNGKKYIGMHKSERVDENYYGSGVIFTQALNKYGKENFTLEVLKWCQDKESLLDAEKHYIKKFNAVESEQYYNVAYGGEGGDTYSGLSNERKQQLSNLSKQRWNNSGIKYKTSQKINDTINSVAVKTVIQESLKLYHNDPYRLEQMKLKVSKALKGVPKSSTHKQHISESCVLNGSHKGSKNGMYNVHRLKEDNPVFNCHYYNNGEIEHLISEEDYETNYKQQGFVKGRLQSRLDALHKDLSKRLQGNTYNKGRIRIHKDNLEKLVYPTQLDEFIKCGWVKGRKPKLSI